MSHVTHAEQTPPAMAGARGSLPPGDIASVPGQAFVPPRRKNAEIEPAARSGASTALAGQVLHFAEGCEIYGEGQVVWSFYKVVGGLVRTCTFTSDGRRQIDGFHGAGEIFGLEMGAEHRLSAEAVSDCSVIAYRWPGPATFGAGDGETTHAMFEYAMACMERAREHSRLLGRRSAAQKLAAFLVELVDRQGGRGAGIDLAMSRQDIADYLGLTIETVSRTLSLFEHERLISLPLTRRVVVQNLAALRNLAD